MNNLALNPTISFQKQPIAKEFTPGLMFAKYEEDPPCQNITYISIKGMGARASRPVYRILAPLFLETP